jgi:putative ABC transport system permease protein
MRLRDGTETAIGSVALEAGVLELFGVQPLAGRLFTAADASARQRVLINESAMRRFGFASPALAVGKVVPDADTRADPQEIIGVVPDFAFYSIEREIGPTVYGNHGGPDDRFFDLIDVKLDGRHVPETLTSIQRLWKATGASEPLRSFFLDDYMQNLYLAVLRFAQAFALMAGIAVLLACLGLVGLSASTTDRRTKEIGIRKALGASTGAIVRLLIWQFTKPVLWAAVMAAPLSAWLMHRWLEGFAYHVELSAWPFLASAALAVGIAVLTVSAHSYAVARAKPIAALRYE